MARRAERRTRATFEDEETPPFDLMRSIRELQTSIKVAGYALLGACLRPFGGEPPKPKKGDVAAAILGFPLVGLGAGLIAAVVYWLASSLGLSAFPAAVLAVATLVFLNGGGNEGELARLADTLIGGGTKTKQLAQLKAETIGAYGIAVMVLCLALRVGAVASLATPGAVAGALGAAMAVSFTAMAVALYALPPARRSGFAFQAGRPAGDQTIIVCVVTALIALVCLAVDVKLALVALIVGALGGFKFAWFAQRNFGGTTRAVLGGVQQGAEIGVLLAVAALA